MILGVPGNAVRLRAAHVDGADFRTRRTTDPASCLHNVSDRDHLTSRGGSL